MKHHVVSRSNDNRIILCFRQSIASVSAIFTISILSLCTMTGCGTTVPLPTSDSLPVNTLVDESGLPIEADESQDTVKGSRDNTPQIMKPSAPGNDKCGNEKVELDISNIDSGYFVVNYGGGNPKVKIEVNGPENIQYLFDITDGDQVIPLTQSSGTYNIAIHENVSDNTYAMIFSTEITANITNEFSPYLYPNCYVDFDETSDVVAMGEDLAYTADSDLDVISNVFNYVITNITYDDAFAASVGKGYTPYPDNTLHSKKGICFDFSSLMAAMLRSQRIPTRLEVGYAGETYHAWISTYIEDIGWVNGIIEFDGENWELMDPTFSASNGTERVQQYIDDGNYTTQYMY